MMQFTINTHMCSDDLNGIRQSLSLSKSSIIMLSSVDIISLTRLNSLALIPGIYVIKHPCYIRTVIHVGNSYTLHVYPCVDTGQVAHAVPVPA